MSVQVQRLENTVPRGGAAFRLGIRSEINEYLCNCFARNGINAAVRDNMLVLGPASSSMADKLSQAPVTLHLSGTT